MLLFEEGLEGEAKTKGGKQPNSFCVLFSPGAFGEIQNPSRKRSSGAGSHPTSDILPSGSTRSGGTRVLLHQGFWITRSSPRTWLYIPDGTLSEMMDMSRSKHYKLKKDDETSRLFIICNYLQLSNNPESNIDRDPSILYLRTSVHFQLRLTQLVSSPAYFR